MKGPKMIWVPEVKKSNYDADMLDNLNSKYDIDSGSSSHTTKEINKLSYFTHTRRKFSLYKTRQNH